ncbi:uncharacterized protein LOC122038143 [Zingiber officinale]|uniref:uncharacterized protein LOC122038143 n=1 Tax=Zingiber officinale TaxID=94328 RepID=UPI001C4AA1D3|nr:uncharacterized protein LOC122038143 [Zingiber officinale]
MTRSSTSELLDFDSEIDRTFHILLRNQKRAKTTSTSSFPVTEFNMENKQTLRELAAPDVSYNSLCIQYPELEVDFELRSGLIHLLPKFNGLSGEDPSRHLQEFHAVCSTMKPHGIGEEDIYLRAFPFSLAGAAKDWLYSRTPGTITFWVDMKRSFLEKFFPASRAGAIRRAICSVQQLSGETLYEYWERFEKLCSSCLHHQISDHLLIQYFYEGLLPMDRCMIDAASGGALVNKTPAEAREIISTMAANAQQFGNRQESTKGVNGAQLTKLDAQDIKNSLLQEMTSAFRQLALSHSQQPTTQAVPTVMICGLCFCSSHTTDICPLLQQEGISFVSDHVAVANNFQPRSQFYQQPSGNKQPYDPFSTTYNPGWRDHPNLKYGNPYQQQPYQHPYQQQPYQQLSSSSQRPAVCPSLPQLPYRPSQLQLPKPELTTQKLEELIQQMQLMTSNQQNLERQIGQMATSITQLQSQGSGQLPSQIVPNPKGNVSAITLRSGKSTREAELIPLAPVTNSVSLEQETEQSGHLPFPQRSV